MEPPTKEVCVSSPRRSPDGSDDNSDDHNTLGDVSQLTDNTSTSRFQAISNVLVQSLSILKGELPSPQADDTVSELDLQSPQQPRQQSSVVLESAVSTPRQLFPDDDDKEQKQEPVAIDFLKDPPNQMTYSRRIALHLMKTKKWYNPRLGEEQQQEQNKETTDLVQQDSNGQTTATPSPSTTMQHQDGATMNGNHNSASPDSDVAALLSGQQNKTTKDNNSDDDKDDDASTSTTTKSVFYDPHKCTKLEFPSLEKAWAYFEHVTLPRFVYDPKLEAANEAAQQERNCTARLWRMCFKGSIEMDRAEMGEKYLHTKLYSPIFTPLSQMGDFGLGFGLYFSTLVFCVVITILAGILNTPNFMYFSGETYSAGQDGVATLLKGSAICTNVEWVPCPTCELEDFKNTPNRIMNVTDDDNNNVLTFALRNDCDGATIQQGFVNYATLMFLLISIIFMNWYQKRMEIKFDEDEQTAQDYSIIVANPPPDATDPEEWKAFFENNFDNVHVTCCTVAVDNDFLVKCLVERRECFRKLEMLLPPGTSLHPLDLARIAAKAERERKGFANLLAMVIPGIPELVGRIVVLEGKVQGLAQQDYPATKIFITFETEAAQRQVLTALSVGSIKARRNDTKVIADPKHLFRGTQVLKVTEPDEPSTVRWQDLNVKFKARCKQLFTTTVACILTIALVAFIISICNDADPTFAAFAIAIFNAIFPEFGKLLTNMESHASEGAKQTSLYSKIAVFRWVNTAIVITIITPFTRTLENGGLIESIYAIFFAELVTTNAIQLADPAGHLKRHFLAPRAATQDLMNLNMQGTIVQLAERYTNTTKIIFLTLWYCALYPGAFFMCAFILLVNYFVDRFSLMRTWARAPKLGTRIAAFSRKYFFSSTIVAMAIISSYAWAGFPYDNLCENDEVVGENVLTPSESEYVGTWQINTGEKVTVEAGDPVYRYCLQDLFRTPGRSFPALPKFQPEGGEWMTEDQELVTNVYGWTSIGVLAIVVLYFLWGFLEQIMQMFRSSYSPNGDDQGIGFSDVQAISTYVPQVESPVFSYPLVACDIDGIDPELFDWTDPDHPHSFYDLTKDAEQLLKGIDVPATHVFSKLVHWPPKEEEEEKLLRQVASF